MEQKRRREEMMEKQTDDVIFDKMIVNHATCATDDCAIVREITYAKKVECNLLKNAWAIKRPPFYTVFDSIKKEQQQQKDGKWNKREPQMNDKPIMQHFKPGVFVLSTTEMNENKQISRFPNIFRLDEKEICKFTADVFYKKTNCYDKAEQDKMYKKQRVQTVLAKKNGEDELVKVVKLKRYEKYPNSFLKDMTIGDYMHKQEDLLQAIFPNLYRLDSEGRLELFCATVLYRQFDYYPHNEIYRANDFVPVPIQVIKGDKRKDPKDLIFAYSQQ